MQIREGDEVFKLGDDVFYIIDGPQYYEMMPDDEEDEVCEECGKGGTKRKVLVECDYCLRPYHEGCLETKPEEGVSWKCPMCEAGKPPPDSPPGNNIQMLLRTKGIVGVGRIVRLSRVGNGEAQVECRITSPQSNRVHSYRLLVS